MFHKDFVEQATVVPVYMTPASAFGQTLAPGTTVISTIRLENSGPACKKMLTHLLKGVVLAFDLSCEELDVTVKPTKDIPSVEESREIFKNLFKTPIATQVMVPQDIQSALQQHSVPKLSCYHPAKVPFDSPELYERMLTLIVANGVGLVACYASKPSVGDLEIFLSHWMKQYLPGCSLKRHVSSSGEPEVDVCTYNPKSSTMLIYRTTLERNVTYTMFLELGKPVMLSHYQRAAIWRNVYPRAFERPALLKADTHVQGIFEKIVARLEAPAKTASTKKHAVPISPSQGVGSKPMAPDAAVILEQLGVIAFYFRTFGGTPENALTVLSQPDLAKLVPSIRMYRIAGLALNPAYSPYYIAFPTLAPMPVGKLYAVSLKTGQVFRSKTPMMLLGTKTRGQHTVCVLVWHDGKPPAMRQPLTQNELFETLPQ